MKNWLKQVKFVVLALTVGAGLLATSGCHHCCGDGAVETAAPAAPAAPAPAK